MILCLLAAALAAPPRASSEHQDEGGERHGAALAFDGLLTTAWIPADGTGAGAWVELPLDRPTEIRSVSLWPGDLSRSGRSVRESSRPRTVTVSLVGEGDPVTRQVRIPDPAQDRPARVDVRIEGTARAVRVTIDDVYEGVLRARAPIAEIALNHIDEAPPPGLDRVEAWLGTDPGERATKRDEREMEIVYSVLGSQDPEQLTQLDAARDTLIDRSANGAPYLREQVTRLVPAGFRVRAIAPDETAITRLLDAGDALAVPAVELAALRSVGPLERTLWDRADRLAALADLQTGQRLHVPPWGEAGWSRGQLRSFEEPLAVVVDRFGLPYVADLGNNRIQRFNERGVVDRAWGDEEADISNEWIGGTRRWYAAGSRAGTGPGVFTLPLDVALIPGKLADGLVVLDAERRVQVFDEEGNFQASFTLPTRDAIRPRLGGQAYVRYAKKKIVAIWGDEGFVFKKDGTEVGRFEIEDGAPSGAVLFKNGRLGLIFQQTLIGYSLDGFRHGPMLGAELAEGFESWDVTLDEEGKIWAVTDTGRLYKFTRPGLIEVDVEASDRPLEVPRLAVREGRAYITDRDRVLVVDAVQVQAEGALEAGGLD